MLAHKHMPKLAAALMALAVCLCLVASLCSGALKDAFGGSGITVEYETALFNTAAPLSINIQMDADDWQAMLDNAMAEEYYSCDVEINGESFYQVGIRTKGNTSLSSIASDPTTDRYSFKLEFDQYVDGQTCYGLDKLVLNNNYADATSMKEALVYDMYQFLGADASLYNYAAIYVNGEYWGVYLALEAVEDSFLLRNYGAESGALYKPEGMDMGRGGGGGGEERPSGDNGFSFTPTEQQDGDMEQPQAGGFGRRGEMPSGGEVADRQPPNMPDMSDMPDMPEGEERSDGNWAAQMPDMDGAMQDASQQPEGMEAPNNMPDMPEDFDFSQMGDRGGMFSVSGGADLNYTDDELDSYQTIWDGEVTKTGKSDHTRVVTALKNIAAGNELERYMDVDNLLKYMAVHAFSVNLDSLSGNMAHNYYLYEYDGRLNLLPWDYNLAFGGFGGSADSVVNSDIYDPFAGTEFFDTLLENETYRAQYEAYLRQLVEEYVSGGGWEEFYTRTRSQLDSLVESDPTAFYSYDEYDTAVELLREVVQLRAQSVLSQLSGGEGVDTDDLDLSAMGGMNNGGMGGMRDNMPDNMDNMMNMMDGMGGFENGFPMKRAS